MLDEGRGKGTPILLTRMSLPFVPMISTQVTPLRMITIPSSAFRSLSFLAWCIMWIESVSATQSSMSGIELNVC